MLEGLNLSFSSSIKKGTVELSGSSTTINENSFKSSDINAVVSVKVTNQVTTVDEYAEYEAMDSAPPGTAAFDEAYGDSYISGFITGGEFTGIISIKVIDRSNVRSVVNKIRWALAATPAKDELVFGPVDAALGSTLSSTLSSTETTISVAWMGGGEIKDREFPQAFYNQAAANRSICSLRFVELGQHSGCCCCIPIESRRAPSEDVCHLDQVQGEQELYESGSGQHVEATRV